MSVSASAGVRVVVLCGYGSELYPLVPLRRVELERERASEAVKAVLPVGGRAMLDWVIDMAEHAGLSGQSAHSQQA